MPLYRDAFVPSDFGTAISGTPLFSRMPLYQAIHCNAISLVTDKMGLVVPISHGNLRITNYRGKYRGILPWKFYREELWIFP